jgi:hypothetical protein
MTRRLPPTRRTIAAARPDGCRRRDAPSPPRARTAAADATHHRRSAPGRPPRRVAPAQHPRTAPQRARTRTAPQRTPAPQPAPLESLLGLRPSSPPQDTPLTNRPLC